MWSSSAVKTQGSNVIPNYINCQVLTGMKKAIAENSAIALKMPILLFFHRLAATFLGQIGCLAAFFTLIGQLAAASAGITHFNLLFFVFVLSHS
jgi:hypothetical protein